MKIKIFNLIRNIDFFGRTITFEEKNQQTVKNIYTGILSLFMLITVTILSYFFGKELWERKKPSSFVSEYKVANAEYELKDFSILFTIASERMLPLNEKLDVYDI